MLSYAFEELFWKIWCYILEVGGGATLFVALQWELGLKLQTSGIDSYSGGTAIVGDDVLMVAVVAVVAMVVTVVIALQQELGIKLQMSGIDSYGESVIHTVEASVSLVRVMTMHLWWRGGNGLHCSATGVRNQVTNVRNRFIPQSRYRWQQLYKHHHVMVVVVMIVMAVTVFIRLCNRI